MTCSTKIRLIRISLVAFLSAITFSVGPAHAALLEGKSLQVQQFHLNEENSLTTGEFSGPIVVGPGVELTNFGDDVFGVPSPLIVNIDISDTNILITALTDQPPAYRELFAFIGDPNSFNFFPAVKRVEVNPATNWAGFNPAGVQLSNRLDIVLSQATGLQGQIISLDLIPIPEPAAVGVGLVSLAAIAAARRKLA